MLPTPTPLYSQLNLILTLFLSELVEEAGLADAHVPNDDVLEDVGVVIRSARHSKRAKL